MSVTTLAHSRTSEHQSRSRLQKRPSGTIPDDPGTIPDDPGTIPDDPICK